MQLVISVWNISQENADFGSNRNSSLQT